MTRFLQTKFWAEFKSNNGWNYIPCEYEGKIINVLTRQINLKIKKITIAYIPMAPEKENLKDNPDNLIQEFNQITSKIRNQLPKNCFCIRFDPAIDFEELDTKSNYVENFRQSVKNIRHINKNSIKIRHNSVAIQPPDTVLLSLNKTEEELLAQMKSKWRYNIRLAQKKDVQIFCYTAKDEEFATAFDEFYKLFQQTSERDGVQFHKKSYYEDLLKKSSQDENAPSVRLYIAKHENDYLAGIITLFCPREAVYLYGASGNIKRNFMPAYLLQWTAIQDAKKYGCPVYDFYGCPPTDDENHPMHGLFLFKTGFGGKLIHRPGSFDVILNESNFKLYSAAEKLRAWYFKVLCKKLHGR